MPVALAYIVILGLIPDESILGVGRGTPVPLTAAPKSIGKLLIVRLGPTGGRTTLVHMYNPK